KKRWQDKNIEVEVRQFFPWGEKEMAQLGNFEKYPPFMPCPYPWQYLVVQWNGDVVPCCRDYNAVITLGNVKKSSLKEIWNSSRYEEFRRQMAIGKFHNNPICSPCLDLYYTENKD
ncbi:SPASM domain-containing protein, partial [bacterium]|nr:SPASM domain-containing protein [bacterium]